MIILKIYMRFPVKPWLLFFIVLFLLNPFKSTAAPLTLYWTGHVIDVTSFKEGAVPTGVSQGSLITGSLLFQIEQYYSSSIVYGTIDNGQRFRYAEGLEQTINIGKWEWMIKGASVSLLNMDLLVVNETWQAFDVYSTSASCSSDLFPSYVGQFEYGFALFDRNLPLQLLSSYEIQTMDLALEQVTYANGFLTTRLWDENRNIIDGYYIDFAIDQVSTSPVPIPSSLFMLISGIGGLVIMHKKRACNLKELNK